MIEVFADSYFYLALANPQDQADWSLVDCISFHVMTMRGIRIALTGDKDYEQAGFQAVLRQP